MALGNVGHAHRLDQLVHRACLKTPLNAGLLNDCSHGLLNGASRLKEARKVAALVQLGDFQVDVAGAGWPQALTVAIAAVCPVWAFDLEAGTAQTFDAELYHAPGNELNHLLEQFSICPFSTNSVNATVDSVIVVSLVKDNSETQR